MKIFTTFLALLALCATAEALAGETPVGNAVFIEREFLVDPEACISGMDLTSFQYAGFCQVRQFKNDTNVFYTVASRSYRLEKLYRIDARTKARVSVYLEGGEIDSFAPAERYAVYVSLTDTNSPVPSAEQFAEYATRALREVPAGALKANFFTLVR